MNVWLAILSFVLLVLLGTVRLLRPAAPSLSRFEIDRRAKLHDEAALLERRREHAEPAIMNLRRIVSVLLLLGLLWSLSMLVGGWSVVIVVAVVLISGVFERTPKAEHRLYAKIEPGVLKVAESRALQVLPTAKPVRTEPRVHSTEELADVIKHAGFLDAREREIVGAAIDFPRLTVRDVMRPKSSLESIDKGEVLGPLVIDDLYKTGESVFLVTDTGIDHVVGLLPLEKLTGLELTGSPTALKAMDDAVEFIGESEPVSEALRILRSGQTQLLIVQDNDAHTRGAVSIGDIIDRLFAEQ